MKGPENLIVQVFGKLGRIDAVFHSLEVDCRKGTAPSLPVVPAHGQSAVQPRRVVPTIPRTRVEALSLQNFTVRTMQNWSQNEKFDSGSINAPLE
ncbi:hypothetical protein RGCCGE502_19330 [Rhizobium grahamii CCGE 502]|uniref:Uncharacterized protein n=1 Tax=Rhizobium grahamii CCGE 502 TaxID=990285 RepID=S3HCU0_9HYPH|nr:hypothetical protein RGCCGE502_19330 [Rhizobium grahamii CCGE 502]